MHISKRKRWFNVKFSTYYFRMKTKVLADFQTCVSVPLIITARARNSTHYNANAKILMAQSYAMCFPI